MANFSHVEPINQYSWWGSHITPYNARWIHENLKGCTLSSFSHARSSFLCCPSSHAIPKLLTPAKFVHCNTRWIHENLKGMDVKVKAMLKLIEEDGDSFARRAEMYYKRRPELKKLVEEFDGGYRALSERYEHSTKALRQVHRTLAEALPNQMPPLSSEESQYGLSDTEMEPHTSEFPLPVRHLFGSKEKQKDDLSSTKTLTQYSEVLAPGEVYENKAQDWDQGAIVKKESSNVIKNLQQDITQLSSEIHVLKDQLIKESKRANNAESEVQSLRRSLSKLSSENDAALLQYQASIEKISGLELLLSRTQRDLEKISNDMVKEANKLKIAEQLNQSLQLGLDTLEQKTKVQELEIIQKQEDLEKLQATIQGKFHQFLEAEVALLSYKNRYFQSEEEAKHLDLEVQKGIAKLRNVEEGNRALEEEICKVREENSNLSEQILRFTLTMEGLEGKIIILNANKRKVEDEQRILLKEKEVLIQEIYCVKVDKNVLEQRYHELIDKMQAARKHTETLQAAIKELQNGNCELKEVCKEHEAEKELLVGKLTDMNKFSEKNTILERLLSDANTEVEVLREKVIALECTHESLKSEIYNYMSERDSLAVQLKDYMENIEMLVEKNTLLENSLSDSSREVENMKAKLKTLEDDSQSIRDQNFGLLSEKYALLMKVESVSTILENLEKLRDVLQVEKQQHEDCILSYKNLLKNLENKISLLQEENQHMEKDLEIGEHNLIDALMENFILRRSLFNLKEGNLVLALEGKNYLEACRSAETQVSRLEQEKMVQMRQILSLTKHNEKISEKIHLLCKAINFNKAFKSAEEIQDEFLLELITSEIVKLIDYISHAEDNNQQLQLEISVLVTLLRHIKNDIVNLRLQKHSLESELEDKNCELITLANEKHELLGWNEQLTSSIEASKQREEALETDIKFLRMHVNGAQETLQTTQREITKLIEERENLSQEGCYLRRQYNILEEEHNEALAEAMKMNHLYLLFKSLDADRVNEVKCLCHELDSLQVTKNNFASEISRLYEKISMLEAEKMHSSDSITSLEEELKNRLLILECDLNFVTSLCEELNLQTETMENQLMEKQIQQSAANQRIKSTQEEKMRLNRLIEALNMENIESRLSKEEMREKISKFSEVVAEGGMSMMPNNMQLLTVNESLQDEKIDELLVEDEIISMVLKVTLVSELSLNKKIFEELKNKFHDMESKDKEQKADLDINLMMLKSLWNGVASLERQITSISKLEQLNSNAKDKEPHSVNQPSENPRDMRTGGVLLEKLINKVESLQKVLSNNMSLLEKERLDLSSSLDLARKEIEMLKIIDIEARGALRMNNGSAKQLDAYPECPDFFKGKHGEIPKDIQLEQASSSFALREASSRRLSTRNSDFKDQSWECFEISHKFQTGKTSSITTGDCILSTEEEESYPSSSSRITKLSIDKLDVCKISLEHKQQWRKRLLERLNTDAQKLLNLKRSREEMIKKLRSHKDKLASNEFDSLKQHLEETQGAMLELIDANIRLKNMGKDFNPSDNRAIKDDDGDSTKRRQISELAKWESEKVGRLERKLRKIQHVLMKIEDEHENKHTRKRIILRDYFYGGENPRQKTLLCGCLQV